MINLSGKRVLVTGAASMVGRSIVSALEKEGAIVDEVLHEQCDLLDFQQCLARFEEFKPQYCVHAAGYNGNIGFNKQYPADIFYNTTIIGLNTLKACALVGVEKVVSLLASCAYRSTNEELKEDEFLNGMPNETVEAHGLSKKTLFYYSKQINKQFGVEAVCTIFNTAYGPYDSYDLNKTKVTGALIKKFTDAAHNKYPEVECWGTGSPRRELIYCDDAACGVVEVLKKYDDVSCPINIGFNQDISIKELAEKISKIVGFEGEITWDKTKPDGQYRKILNAERMKEYNITIQNPSTLDEGLARTIEWYKENVL